MDQAFIEKNDIKKVNGNLFLVPFNLIDKDTFNPSDDEDFIFLNPRIICETYDTNPIGLEIEDMEYLKTSIQQKGLLTPLIARFKDNRICLINGHRRYLAIQRLIQNNDICFDNNKNSNDPASQIYSHVLVKVFSDANEIDSYVLAFEEDKTKVKFGLGVEYKFVEFCLQRKVPDEKIINMTGNTSSWLDGVKQLFEKLNGDCPIDNEIRDAIYTNKMSIGAAKSLADIEDPQERKKEFHNAFMRAEEEASVKRVKLEKQLKNINKKIDSVKAQSIICGTAGDLQGKQSADDILNEVLAEEKEIQNKQKSISPVVTANNVGPRNAKSNKKNQQQKKKQEKEKEEEQQDTESNKDTSISISKNFLVQNWLNNISNIQNSEIDGIVIDSALLEVTTDLINSLINDQSCEDFLVYWSKELRRKSKFAE
jgi:hypothetical protein